MGTSCLIVMHIIPTEPVSIPHGVNDFINSSRNHEGIQYIQHNYCVFFIKHFFLFFSSYHLKQEMEENDCLRRNKRRQENCSAVTYVLEQLAVCHFCTLYFVIIRSDCGSSDEQLTCNQI